MNYTFTGIPYFKFCVNFSRGLLARINEKIKHIYIQRPHKRLLKKCLNFAKNAENRT